MVGSYIVFLNSQPAAHTRLIAELSGTSIYKLER